MNAVPRTRSRRRAAAAATCLAAATAAVVAGASPAAATPSKPHVRFVINEKVDHTTESYTFTASAPLCPSGTFTDDPTIVNLDRKHTIQVWVVQTTYACDDGSGTFTATKKLLRIEHHNKAINTGFVVFTGGTGLYTHLAGKGTDHGKSAHQHGAGTIRGHLTSLPDIP